MACCQNPDPRILEKNGRPFCVNCRRYLDARAPEPPPVEIVVEPPTEGEEAQVGDS